MVASLYSTLQIRNVCLVGSMGTGKTSVIEAVALISGIITRLGKTEEGNTVSDYTPEERNRRCSIHLTPMYIEFNHTKINLLDTPGYADFFGDTYAALGATDSALFVVDGSGNIEPDTETLWEECITRHLPRVIFVNKIDKENVNYRQFIEHLQTKFSGTIIPVIIPLEEGTQCNKLVNLLENVVYEYHNGQRKKSNVPENVIAQVNAYRDKLIESIAAEDELLIEKYLEGKELSPDELVTALKKAILNERIVPVLTGSATNNFGITELLEFIVNFIPHPGSIPRFTLQGSDKKINPDANDTVGTALVFKTYLEPHTGRVTFFRVINGTLTAGSDIYNPKHRMRERIGQLFNVQGTKRTDTAKLSAGDIGAVVKLKETLTNDTLNTNFSDDTIVTPLTFPPPVLDLAIYTLTQGEEDKLANALSAVVQEDPTLKFNYNTETKEWIISGLGESQLDVTALKIKDRANVNVELRAPRIPYKETIKIVSEQQGKYKRQSGGRGQYGDCWLRIEPLPRDQAYEFVDKITQGRIPKNYIPSIEKGVKDAIETGVIAGYQVVNVRVTLYDGSYHEVDSSDIAFKIAGRMAFKKCMETANPTILEPIMNVDITVPEDYVGAVMGDLNARRGRVIGLEPMPRRQTIRAQVPLGETYRYTTDIRSMTKGAGRFQMNLSHYEEAPVPIRQKLIDEFQRTRTEKE